MNNHRLSILITAVFLFIFGAGVGLYATGIFNVVHPARVSQALLAPQAANEDVQTNQDEIATATDQATPAADETQEAVLGARKERVGFPNQQLPQKQVLGYLPYWMLDSAELIQLDNLSYLAYFSIEANGEGNFVKVLPDFTAHIGWIRWNGDRFAQLIEKAHEQNVSVLLTVSMLDNDNIKALLDCGECQTLLMDNISNELIAKNADGVVIDFEYTGQIEENQPTKLTEFVSALRNQLNKRVPGSKLIVTTTANTPVRPTLWQLSELVKTTDYIAVMAYDFSNVNSAKAGPVAPLGTKAQSYDYDYQRMFADYLTVVPKEELIIIVPYYGYDWPVKDESQNSKTLKDTKGVTVTYDKTVEQINQENITPLWDEEAKSPWYSYLDTDSETLHQVHYENAQSLAYKYDLVRNYDIAGVGIWALGYDGSEPELWQLLQTKFTIQKVGPRPDPYDF